MSRVLNIRSPGLLMLDHRVQDDQELAHAGGQSHFPGLARRTKAVVKGLDDGFIPVGGKARHIKGSPHSGLSAPDSPFAPEAAAVSIEGGDSYQRGNPVAAQSAQFRKVGQQGDGHHPADSWDAAQQIVLLSPEGTLPQGVVQVIIQISQLLFQPADMVLDPLAHCFRPSGPQPILLGSKHLDDLVPPSQEGGQFLSLGIQLIGLRQLAGSSGKVSNLAGIDHGHGQPSTSQSARHGHLESARGLQYHQFWVELSQSLDYLDDTWSIVSHAPSLASGTHGDIQLVFGDVYSYVRIFRFQCLPPYWPFLARCGLCWPRQLFGLFPERSWRPKLFDGLGGPREERSASSLGQDSINIGSLSNIQGGEDIAYGWKGKGSTVHLVTEGNGVPLAFLVTAANVAGGPVGLKVVDGGRVPRPK